MTIPVLSYAPRRETHAPGTSALLWVWAIVDVAAGLLLGFLGFVGTALSREIAVESAVFLVIGLLGTALCGWGFKTAGWAIRIYRGEPGLAEWLEGVVRLIRRTLVTLLVAYLAVAVMAIDVPWMIGLLFLGVPHVLAIVALWGTGGQLAHVAWEDRMAATGSQGGVPGALEAPG